MRTVLLKKTNNNTFTIAAKKEVFLGGGVGVLQSQA